MEKQTEEKEILACNEEISKELFSKELHVIVTDGLHASRDTGEEMKQPDHS
ncbi:MULTISPECIES: hypothetical protein [unclassified Sutcliffiella]|jgi:hypothetical protein|uniref:hypothetical protein n=1 Tax=unclassified Sutcliffiella TaxID=2837532 RepID=UPI0030D057CF